MTISQDSSGATVLSHVVVVPAIVNDYDGGARCPDCGLSVDDQEGIHDVPSGLVEGLSVGQEVPIYGYRCDRHRQPHVLPAPAALAPSPNDTVRLDIGGGLEVGRPDRAADGGGLDV